MSDDSFTSEEDPSAKPNGRQLRSGKVTALYGLMGSLSLENIQSQPNGVGYFYDERLEKTHCLLDSAYPESPERLIQVKERLKHYKLPQRCINIQPHMATKEDILKIHSEEFYNLVENSQHLSEEELKKLSYKYDGVYFHPNTFESAMLCAGSHLALVDQLLTSKVRHAMTVSRPPGHHAMRDEPNGYCIFNNVALVAKHAIEEYGLRKVLIVDWDVHHGQGTQSIFYDDPHILYFSIHRYDYGKFWPELRESDYDHIGTGKGRGFNINVPFNEECMMDSDYMAIFHQILLPVASEFSPELVIVSCGYDAGMGDVEGECGVTPPCFAHFTELLKTIAGGRLFLSFEGGYCLKSMAEGAALTLRCLLGDPCPLLPPLPPPQEKTVETILQVVRVLRPYWKCFTQDEAESIEDLPNIFKHIEMPKKGVIFHEKTTYYDDYGDDVYFRKSAEWHSAWDEQIDKCISQMRIFSPPNRTCIVYDEGMQTHRCVSKSEEYVMHPERPERISRIFEKHNECGLIDRCKRLKSRQATNEELTLAHTQKHVDTVKAYQDKTRKELSEMEGKLDSVYLSQEVYECAAIATGCTLNIVDEVMSGRSRNGSAIVRPPGHHAEPHTAMGFCYFNSVAIAAKYAQKHYDVRRVLILDWDVHHGNGTQHIFEYDASVLYISIHRHDNGFFFPNGADGNAYHTGNGSGTGFNINIPWNSSRMGDAEYITAFQQVVMSVAYEFAPDLVLVSAGFDAARGDPLGGCRVSPECYAHMTHMLGQLAGGRIILVLEGGYNLHSISESFTQCTSILLGDLCPPILYEPTCPSAVASIRQVLHIQKKYWKSLQFGVLMPSHEDTVEWLENLLPLVSFFPLHTDEKTPTDSADEKNMSGLTDDMSQVKVEPEQSAASTTESEPSAGSAGDMETCEGACGGSSKTQAQMVEEFLGPAVQGQKSVELFAVTPLPWCPHLKEVAEVPAAGLHTLDPCKECGNVGENWVCLHCYEVHCSRYVQEHMLMHSVETEHRLALSYADLSVWCYACDTYVHHELLLPAKNFAHMSKFGEGLPGS